MLSSVAAHAHAACADTNVSHRSTPRRLCAHATGRSHVGGTIHMCVSFQIDLKTVSVADQRNLPRNAIYRNGPVISYYNSLQSDAMATLGSPSILLVIGAHLQPEHVLLHINCQQHAQQTAEQTCLCSVSIWTEESCKTNRFCVVKYEENCFPSHPQCWLREMAVLTNKEEHSFCQSGFVLRPTAMCFLQLM